ncbi:MAG: hypothetical protein K0M67_16490 [Thiobacillus sp.]|nr:hypothetical protein [Thiobacillus sp.]
MSKLWTWVKTAGGALVKGAAGWKVYAGIAALTLVAAASVLTWFNHRINTAYEAGQKATQVDQLKGEVDTLRSISDANKESNDAIAKNLEALGGMGARVNDLERVRRADLANIDQRIRSAAEPAVRAYAIQAERDIGAVEQERDGFAHEAVRASTAAWAHRDTLQARRDALNIQRQALKPTKETKP